MFEIIEVIPSGTSADDKSNPAKELIIVAKFKNFGKTPSLNTGIIHTVRGVPIGEETSPLFDKPLVVPESGGAVVAPGAALYADEIRIPENLVNLFRAKKVRIDLCVFVGYRDLFNKKKLRTTVTVIKILHNGFEVDPNGQRFDRTESSLSDPRNGAD